ncbi:uncharacterized protein B0H64DRAFT_364927 [Chaetomium fimeti]|uniref:Rad60/SUMO-like domain-containing protein n=1 Tax=Chaetomium fimeti TaxID=1854472 RepID=A0AAE0H923_9PEZI|nr:hypothetical protein B0H64DRAFT_364927 [Chaetomium fimeti]
MATMMPEHDILSPPKKRALPFKRTVARKQQSSEEPKKPEEDNDLDLFRHSKEVFPEVLREAKEAGEEKDQSQNDHKRRKLSSSSSSDPIHSRKRSTVADESDDDLIMDVKGKGKEIIRPRRLSTPPGPSSAQTLSRTPGSNRTTPKTKTRASRRSRSRNRTGSPALPVTILDDSDEEDIKPTTSRSQPRDSTTDTATPLRSAPPADSSSPIEILTNPLSDPEPPNEDFSEWVNKARALQAAESQNTVATIFITSRLPGCEEPMLVTRRLNQGVQLLLDVWVSRNEAALGPTAAAAEPGRLFLTWKGNKIYGHSTLASLGVQVDARGALRDNVGEGYVRGGGLHLEVWTEEVYAEYLENRGKEWALKLGVEEEGEEEGDVVEAGTGFGGAGEEVPPARKKGIRIVLKAKEHEPLKLTAREETDAEMLVEAFRTQRGIGPEWELAISFDGERLDDDVLISDLDVDPDEVNQLEVLMKEASG